MMCCVIVTVLSDRSDSKRCRNTKVEEEEESEVRFRNWDYDVYEDYDYDFDVQENFEAPETKQENITLGIWRCPICTFDNEEGMSACDICGVLRNPLGNACSNGNKNTVDGMRKDSGASIMARSLFASLPRLIPNKPETFQLWNDNFLMEECNSFCKLGNIQGHSNELHRAFSLRKHIGPFKNDVPSPDDLVSKGLRSSKVGSKANVNKLSSSDVPLSVTEKKIAVELRSDAKSFDTSSAFISDNRHGSIGEDTHSLSNEVQSRSLSSSLNTVKSGSSKNVSARRAVSHAQYKPEKWMLPDHAEDRLTQLNLAIGKGSFAFAWALDESAEERERGITMTVAVAYFDSKRYHIVLLDSPGHKDFVPNMISGATQADAAILVIDASIGSFEAGMDSTGGQTREHAQLIRSFGADQVIVAINKMDVVEYSKEHFDTIKLQLGTFLRSCGFKDSTLSWVPLSAIENQNLMEAASDARLVSWYKGPPLLDAIDSLKPPARDYSKPLLMPICDVIKLQTQGQVSACGKLEAGALRSGSKVLVMPSGEMGTVRSLECDSEACAIARAGDNVAVCLLGIDGSSVMAGGVLCHPDFPVAVAKNLELKILILDVATPILIGSQLEFHIHHAKEAARVVKILSLLDPKTGKVVKKAPRCLLAKQSAVVEVALEEVVCVEEFSSCRALGRVFLRASGRTVAVGVVTRIIEDLQQQQEE
ncbi:HBS1-like protein [Camellia lanceoleosa]|uniref:HBS1-like protein n=1 Tax=Camellia lanceoleosa TaxID=1840588 RepID=A0ACC0G8Y2_9ERIC|nr:HBS1-like protein [Camellia lanceoleosa]